MAWKRNSQLAATSAAATSPSSATGQSSAEERHERQAAEREDDRDEPQGAETAAEVRHPPGEQEVQRRTAAIPRHVLDDAEERVAADEERQRLVLVRRPGASAGARGKPPASGDDRPDSEPEPVRRERAVASPRPARPCATVRAVLGAGVSAARSVVLRRILSASVIDCSAFSLLHSRSDADLRIPLPGRAHLRGLPALRGRALGVVRGVREEPGGEGAVPGRRSLQGLGLLLHRLREGRAQGLPRTGTRRRRTRRSKKETSAPKDSGSSEQKAAATRLTAHVAASRSPTTHPGAYGSPFGGGKRRRAPREHRDRGEVVLRAQDHRLAVCVARLAARGGNAARSRGSARKYAQPSWSS